MAKAFDKWQVFGHRPIEKLEDNLWRVEGDLPGGNGNRVMTIAKMRDGSLVIHNAIALEDELMKEIEAFGTPKTIIVPSGFHRLDSKIFKERYPDAKIVAPAGSRAKIEQVVTVDATYAEAPSDDDVRMFHLDGMKEAEGVLEIKSGDKTTLVFNDCINNIPKAGGFFGVFLAPTGKPCVPRVTRWLMVKNKHAFQTHLQKIADTKNLTRIIMSHGTPFTEGPGDTLRKLATEWGD